MLVLLIIFMVSAPMMTTGIEIDLPKTHAPRMEVEQEKLLLTITKEREVYLGETLVPYEKLEEALTTKRACSKSASSICRPMRRCLTASWPKSWRSCAGVASRNSGS